LSVLSRINRRSTYCRINLNNLQWKFRPRLHLSCQFNKLAAALAKYPRAAAGFAKKILHRHERVYVAKCRSLNNSRGCQCDRFGYAINYFFLSLYLEGIINMMYIQWVIDSAWLRAREKRSSSAAAPFPLWISSLA
jgi:hypothetical protein